MAQAKRETAENAGRWFTNGKDHGKPVRYRVRPIPVAVDRQLHREVYGNAKARQLGRQSATTAIERMQDYTILRAGYALVDTENFSIEIGDPAAAELYSKLLGEVVLPSTEVFLDGKWTDALRKDVLAVARRRAAWISDKADRLVEAEIQDEEDENEGF